MQPLGFSNAAANFNDAELAKMPLKPPALSLDVTGLCNAH